MWLKRSSSLKFWMKQIYTVSRNICTLFIDEREAFIQQQLCLRAVFREVLGCWFKISVVKWPADPSDSQSSFWFCSMGTSPLYAVLVQKQDRFHCLTLPSRRLTSATACSLLLALHHSGLVKPFCYSTRNLPCFPLTSLCLEGL